MCPNENLIKYLSKNYFKYFSKVYLYLKSKDYCICRSILFKFINECNIIHTRVCSEIKYIQSIVN